MSQPKMTEQNPKPSLATPKELLLGDQLASQLSVDVDTCKLYFGVILQQLWQRLDGDLVLLLF
jgi:hypothetical protein